MENIDNAVFKNAKAGNESAFAELVGHYGKLCYSIAYRMLGNVEDAKDISQEVWIKIYKNIGSCKNNVMFRAWMCTIVNNACIDFLRKRSARIKAGSLDELFPADDTRCEMPIADLSSPNPEQEYIDAESKRDLHKAISRLSDTHKQMIILRDIQGLTYEEIAAITSRNLGTVKSQIARARESLRKILLPD